MPLFSDDEYGDLNPMQQLMRSPEMMGAMQGLQNIGNARMNQPMGVSPIQAYQQAVVAQATANQQRKINDLTMQGMEQDLDTFYDYKQFQRQFPEQAKGMTYAQFKTIDNPISGTAPIRNTERYIELRNQALALPEGSPERQLIEDEMKFLGESVRATKYLDAGGGSQRPVNPLTSGIGTGGPSPDVVTSESFIDREKNLKGTVKDAETWATLDADWETAFNESMPRLDQAADLVEEMIEYIEANPDMPTGMIQGYITPKTNELVSTLQTAATLLAIPRLAEAKLQPVTELELQKIMETFADALKDPKANLASLKLSYNQFVKDIGRMTAQQDHYNKAGTLKGYAPSYKSRERKAYDLPGGAPQKIAGPDRPQ